MLLSFEERRRGKRGEEGTSFFTRFDSVMEAIIIFSLAVIKALSFLKEERGGKGEEGKVKSVFARTLQGLAPTRPLISFVG